MYQVVIVDDEPFVLEDLKNRLTGKAPILKSHMRIQIHDMFFLISTPIRSIF